MNLYPQPITLRNRPNEICFIRPLNADDTDASYRLRQDVVNALNKENPNGQTFLHNKDQEQVREILSSNEHVAFGVFTQAGQLVAQRALRIGADKIPLLPDLEKNPDGIGTLHSDMTHPNYQRNGLSFELLKHIHRVALTHQIHNIIACVDIKSSNYPLLERFGFRTMSAYIDPEDNGKTLGVLLSSDPALMQKTYHSSQLPLDDFAAVCHLMACQTQQEPISKQAPQKVTTQLNLPKKTLVLALTNS